MTMGIVFVAFFAATLPGVLTATMTSGFCRTTFREAFGPALGVANVQNEVAPIDPAELPERIEQRA